MGCGSGGGVGAAGVLVGWGQGGAVRWEAGGGDRDRGELGRLGQSKSRNDIPSPVKHGETHYQTRLL